MTEWECLAELLDDPRSARMKGDVKPENLPAPMVNDVEAVQEAEGRRWNDEEVHRCDGVAMISQEVDPGLLLSLGRRDAWHVSANGVRMHVDAETRELPGDARSAPPILRRHSTNQSPCCKVQGRAAGFSAS